MLQILNKTAATPARDTIAIVENGNALLLSFDYHYTINARGLSKNTRRQCVYRYFCRFISVPMKGSTQETAFVTPMGSSGSHALGVRTFLCVCFFLKAAFLNPKKLTAAVLQSTRACVRILVKTKHIGYTFVFTNIEIKSKIVKATH